MLFDFGAESLPASDTIAFAFKKDGDEEQLYKIVEEDRSGQIKIVPSGLIFIFECCRWIFYFGKWLYSVLKIEQIVLTAN